jgi:hypothetical protein
MGLLESVHDANHVLCISLIAHASTRISLPSRR